MIWRHFSSAVIQEPDVSSCIRSHNIDDINMAMKCLLTTLLALAPVCQAFTVEFPPAVRIVAPLEQNVAATPMLSVATAPSNLPTQRDLLSSSMMLSAASTNMVESNLVNIVDINYNGNVPTTEADEYVVIKNGSKSPVDISGYYIYVATTGTQGPTFFFPKDSIVKPGGTVRVYTDEIHKETGGYSFGSKKAIWNNRGGLAVIKDGNGKKIGEFKYKGSS